MSAAWPKLEVGMRVAVYSRWGTVLAIRSLNADLLVDIRFDQPLNGLTERTMLYYDCRPLSILEMIADAARDA